MGAVSKTANDVRTVSVPVPVPEKEKAIYSRDFLIMKNLMFIKLYSYSYK